MALNKFMHPRNLYRTPPDFAKLSKSFEEFSSIAKTDVTGKVTIDFKDPHSLRVLTKCLLKSDFGLDVVIPEDRLVPTLPLRLNYILWIEDLLNSINRIHDIKGLDIGTGACAIYPLLAVVKNKWHFVGTESDAESIKKAQENVDRNKLQDFIQLSKNTTSTLLEYLFTEETSESFDFCMCNPPFYSNVQELCESRSPARLPPKNAFTGSPQELITEGGELTFCRKLIKESKVYKDKVLIFSTMVGHKYNLKELAQDLKADDITHTTTEFCQGRVTRWGLAWTFQNYNIDQLVPGRDKPRKKSLPVVYLLPELHGISYNIETISEKLLDILHNLKISYKVVLNKKGNQLTLNVKAVENTWSNQRRKRRLMKKGKGDAKKPKLDNNSDNVDKVECPNVQSDANENITKINVQALADSKHDDQHSKISIVEDRESNDNSKDAEDTSINTSDENEFSQKTTVNSLIAHNNSGQHTTSDCSEANISANSKLMVHAIFKLLKKDHDILLEMEFLEGTAGKEGVHQIMQYIKNNWK